MVEVQQESKEICPYRSICGPCEGPRAEYRVLLVNGQAVDFRNVVRVVLTESDLIVKPAEGEAMTFARKDVYFAGCGRLAVPFQD